MDMNFVSTDTPEIQEELEVKTLNRNCVLVHLNENFYNWYKAQNLTEKTEEEVLDTPYSFLIPPLDSDEQADEFIAEHCLEILETLLYEFVQSEELIETQLTEDNFDNWVDYNLSHFVFDLGSDYELAYEEDQALLSPQA